MGGWGSILRGVAVVAHSLAVLESSPGDAGEADPGISKQVPRVTPIEMRGVFPLTREVQAMARREGKNVILREDTLEIIKRDYIAGLTFWTSWMHTEPEQGEYDFALIEAIVKAVKAESKTVNLGIGSGPFSPEWIYSAGVPSYTFSQHGRLRKAPVPWDEKFLEMYLGMIEEFANRIKADREAFSPVRRLVIGGPANTQGFEMVMIGHRDEDRKFYREAGYPEKFVDAWKRAVDHYARVFPDEIELVLIWHRGMTGAWTNEYASEAVKHIEARGLAKRFNLQTAGLRGQAWFGIDETPDPDGDWTRIKEMLRMMDGYRNSAGFGIGLQYFCRDTGEPPHRIQQFGSYAKALEMGLRLRPLWVEPWIEDIQDTQDGTATYAEREALLRRFSEALRH
jgi:hypothetical protein